METQELFNQMMENAIVYLQSKGIIPTQQSHIEENKLTQEDITEMLVNRGLLPKKQ